MFRSTRLYRTLGLLVAESGSDVTSSLHVVGRALLEAISHVDWLLRPLRSAGDSPPRVVARRTYLLSLARVAELGFESEDFDMPDLPELNQALDTGRERANRLFGADSTRLAHRNPTHWAIDGEGLPKKAEGVDSVGETVFSPGERKASYYRTPSLAAHASLAAPLGHLIPIEEAGNVHTMYVIDVDAIEGWLWYYTVWYRYGAQLMADVHSWPTDRIAVCDRAAGKLLGRSVFNEALFPSWRRFGPEGRGPTG